MQLEQLANVAFPWRRLRSATQIRGEIEDEVRFHLDERARALEAEGLDPAAAQAEALARFGDVHRTKLDCLTAQLGSGIMVRKIQWLVIGLLLAALAALGLTYSKAVAREREMAMMMRAEAQRAQLAAEGAEREAERARAMMALRESESRSDDRRSPDTVPTPETRVERAAIWRARFAEAPDVWRKASAIAYALIDQLSDEDAVRVLTDVWADLSTTQKQQSLKSFAFRRHANIIPVLHLGATDATLDVQNWAFVYLRDYALQNFSNDYAGYMTWHERWKDATVQDLFVGNAREFVRWIHDRPVEELTDRLLDFDSLDFRPAYAFGVDLAEVFREAGVLDVIEEWLASSDEDAARRAFQWVQTVRPDEAWMRRHMLPELDRNEPGRVQYALLALGDVRNAWAVPELVEYLEWVVLSNGDGVSSFGDGYASAALAEMGGAAVIPTLIGLHIANPEGGANDGLNQLTGVTYDESHDGVWWVDWWSKNQGRFPPEVRAIPIPDYGAPR